MIKRYIFFLAITAICLAYLVLPAVEGAEEASAETCKGRIIASPILYYTPETRLAFVGAGSYIFQLGGCDKKTRPSSLSPLLIYTLEKQFIGELKAELYFKNNGYRLVTELKYRKYPDRFYGIGGLTLEENRENYTYRSTKFYLTFLKKIKKGFNLGFQYRFMDWRLTETEAGGQLASGVIPGSGGGRLSGIGVVVNRDTRDNRFSPLRGDHFEFDVRVYPKFLGSTFEFTRYTLDLRKYFPLFSSHVFAVRSLAVMQTGTVPFLNLAQLGGPYVMRGYFEGRFRDKNLLAFQAEYRLPLFWRLGAVGFAGVGNVAEKFSQLDSGAFKRVYGIGLRFLFDRKQRIQLRIDVGWGKNSTGFYVSVFEAF
jgi:outer membrane protein assembly factor BamA